MSQQNSYDFVSIQKKWNEKWLALDFWKAVDFSSKPKKYVLIEFPYPSAAGLHMGHCWNYTLMDAYSRYHRAKGYNVMFPVGWDSFGLPTYNHAIKVNKDPNDVAAENVKTFRRQLQEMGFSFDWNREVDTSSPEYYKWTQWIFVQLYEHYYDENFVRHDGGKGQARPISDLPVPQEARNQGKLAVKAYQDKFRLAYKTKMPVAWCPKCKTGLANEEVTPQNTHERCDTPVEQRDLEQWMFRITAYGDRLLDDLATVDFTNSMVKAETNWIKRSYGVTITYKVKDTDKDIKVYTTRPETNFGATFVTTAPDGAFVKEYGKLFPNKEAVSVYVAEALKKTQFEREAENKAKTGIFTGWYAINPLTGFEMPIYVSDFVVGSYGTGSLVGVPGHDVRDFEFAQTIGDVKIIRVIDNGDTTDVTSIDQIDKSDDGVLMNSGKFNGLSIIDGREVITKEFESMGIGVRTKNFKFRDWVFSRQHYWGEPTPMVYCKTCGWSAVKTSELPVRLPILNDYKMGEDGSSPLEKAESWKKTVCPECGEEAVRETDVMPNWAGSNWYFLRYIDPKNREKLAEKTKLEYWGQVDIYYGGQEHINLHVLYSRFINKFLYDIGAVPNSEPYAKRIHHGVILGPDGRKMSKSWGNVVNPDEVVGKYGADVVRLYMMFIGPYDSVTPWSDKAIAGVSRFVFRLHEMLSNVVFMVNGGSVNRKSGEVRSLEKLVEKVGNDVEKLKFNTVVSSLMEFYNKENQRQWTKEDMKTFLQVIAPFAPYIAEEFWQKYGFEGSVHAQSWPEVSVDDVIEVVEIPVMINGKVRARLKVAVNEVEDKVVSVAMDITEVKTALPQGHEKVVYVPGKAINFVPKN